MTSNSTKINMTPLEPPSPGTKNIDEYRIQLLEKKLANNQEQILNELKQIKEEFRKDHERIIKLEIEQQIITKKFKRQESYMMAVITTIIAQIIIFILRIYN